MQTRGAGPRDRTAGSLAIGLGRDDDMASGPPTRDRRAAPRPMALLGTMFILLAGCVGQGPASPPVANAAGLDAAAEACIAEAGLPASARSDPNADVTPAQASQVSDCLTRRGFPTTGDATATLDACLAAEGLPPSTQGRSPELTGEQAQSVTACARRGG